MSLVGRLVENPVKVAVGVLLLALFGGLALMRMPMQLTPEVQTPTITIETRWPGASPVEVEREIVQEQEEQLKGIEGLDKVSSECHDSSGKVILEFVVGTDMSTALLKVNSRLQQVREYPEEADEPVITTANSSDRPIGWFILRPLVPDEAAIEAFLKEHPGKRAALEPALRAHNSGLRQRRLESAIAEDPELVALRPPDLDITTYRRYAEDVIEARFERVPGVANANVLGGREDELQVIVDPTALAARQITIGMLREALRGQNADTSAGDFWEGKRRYVVRTLGQFRTPEEVERVIVTRRDGVPVYVRDIADVRLGYKKADGIVRNFGTTSIAVNAVRETGANVLDVMEGLREAVAELSEGVLRRNGLQLKQVYDETDYIYSAVGLVRRNIVLGGLLTIAVLLIFLKSARSTLVVALAIPTSVIGTFLLLNLMGRSLNVISLAGLAFAVGMLVDNAVVVLENIFRHYQEGASRKEAAIKGTQEVWGAVFASTLTTLAVFLPVLFVQEEAGQLFRDIALAISCSVGLSLIISVTLIPTLSVRVLPPESRRDAPPPRVVGILLAPLDKFGHAFRQLILGVNRFVGGRVLRQIALVAVIVAGAVGTTWMLFPKVEYLPTGNRNLVFGILFPPPGYNLDEMVAMGAQIEGGMQPYWDINPGDPGIDDLKYPAILDFFYVARGRQLFMGVRAQDGMRARELVPLVGGMGFTQPGTFGIAVQASLFEQGLTAGRNIDIEISGPELPRLVQLGQSVLMQAMQAVPGARVIPRPSLDLSNPEVHVLPRWTEAADLKMTGRELGYAVNSLVDGAYAGDYFRGGKRIDLTLVGNPDFAGSTQDLNDLPIATASGNLVPLSALAEVKLSSGPEQINRRERQRAITIQVSPPASMALEDAMDRITEKIIRPLEESGELGHEYQLTLAGTADKLKATWEALQLNVILALLITYLLMAALFESWVYPLVIIVSVPLGAGGGFVGLWILNLFVPQPLDVLTMLGFVILIGTVVNNAILIVHQALQLVRAGESRAAAVQGAVRTRIRPIFMTLFTTVFGLLPLVVSPGAGSELYRGLGSVLLGGLLASTLFTLFVVPTLFRLVYRMQAVVTDAK